MVVLEAGAERETVNGTNVVPDDVTVEAGARDNVVDEVIVAETKLLNVVAGAITN